MLSLDDSFKGLGAVAIPKIRMCGYRVFSITKEKRIRFCKQAKTEKGVKNKYCVFQTLRFQLSSLALIVIFWIICSFCHFFSSVYAVVEQAPVPVVHTMYKVPVG